MAKNPANNLHERIAIVGLLVVLYFYGKLNGTAINCIVTNLLVYENNEFLRWFYEFMAVVNTTIRRNGDNHYTRRWAVLAQYKTIFEAKMMKFGSEIRHGTLRLQISKLFNPNREHPLFLGQFAPGTLSMYALPVTRSLNSLPCLWPTSYQLIVFLIM